MSVNRDEVRRIAALARLEFSDTEIDGFTRQFGDILDYVEKLREVDVTGIEPTSQVGGPGAGAVAPMREDEVRPSLGTDAALANAPDPGSGHFKVPKVI